MDNNTYIFHFTFNPSKLRRKRQDIAKKYDNIDELIAKQLKGAKLPRLLDLVRNSTDEMIEELAKAFKKTDILIILYAYPFPEETNETRRRINILLTTRYSSSVGTFAWELFQYSYEDPFLQDLLRRVFAIDAFEFLLSDEKSVFHDQLKKAIVDRNGIANGLVPMFSLGTMKFATIQKSMKMKENAPLENFILYHMLNSGLSEDALIKREGESFITQQLEKYAMTEYKQLMKVYLEARTRERFHITILEQAIRRLYDPRERKADWLFLNETTLNEVIRWLVEIELKKFFEGDTNRRFDFWKRYLHLIDNVIQLKGRNDPKVAFIYFNRFVVVEFGNIGAAYFYHRDGFDRRILSRTLSSDFKRRSSAGKENMLKDTSVKLGGDQLFIHKLGHHGQYSTWMNKFRNHMSYYLDGLFSYREG